MTYHIKEVKRTNENVIKIKSCTLFPSKRNVTRFINLIHEILFWGGWNTVSKAARKYCGLIQTLSPQVGISKSDYTLDFHGTVSVHIWIKN